MKKTPIERIPIMYCPNMERDHAEIHIYKKLMTTHYTFTHLGTIQNGQASNLVTRVVKKLSLKKTKQEFTSAKLKTKLATQPP